MENDEEALRLDRKTDLSQIENQGLWSGIQPGMRIADIGCGPGKITSTLFKLASPGGSAVGIDGSNARLEYAKKLYGRKGIEFVCRNILDPLNDLGTFDFIWVRFVIEYYRENAFELLRNVNQILKPGGILVLVDLDHNPLNHYGFPERLNKTLYSVLSIIEDKYNFDPYAGRKLYSYVYDLNYEEIDVDVSIYSVVFGELQDLNYFNWTKKIEAAHKLTQYNFPEYEGGYDEFLKEFNDAINDKRIFSYTPLICCRGKKPRA